MRSVHVADKHQKSVIDNSAQHDIRRGVFWGHPCNYDVQHPLLDTDSDEVAIQEANKFMLVSAYNIRVCFNWPT